MFEMGADVPKPITLRFVSKIKRAPGVWEFCWRHERRVEFNPGQYADFEVAVLGAGGGRSHSESRTFTIVSHPTETTVRFWMRYEQPGSPYKRALMKLVPGQSVGMTAPIGTTVLPPERTRPLVYIAQGIGIASVLSPLAECVRQASGGSMRDVTIWWIRRPDEQQLLDTNPHQSAITRRHDIVRPQRLDVTDVVAGLPAHPKIFISGTQYFVAAVGDSLQRAGIDRGDIIFDYYEGYVEL